MSNIWMQSHAGRVVDMLDPHLNVIDFQEIATTLSYINRYNGCAVKQQVSVAFHSVIVASLLPKDLVPFGLLHDAHEAIIGDIMTPTAMALEAIAREQCGILGSVADAIRELKRRHDEAIHTAAGLPMPTPKQQKLIRAADLKALNTERRAFLAPEPQSWGAMVEEAGYDEENWRHLWLEPRYQAKALYKAFKSWLPAFKKSESEAA